MSSVICLSIRPSRSTEADFKTKDGLAFTTETNYVKENEKDNNESFIEASGSKEILHAYLIFACFLCYLQIINILSKNNICFLKQTVQGTQIWH